MKASTTSMLVAMAGALINTTAAAAFDINGLPPEVAMHLNDGPWPSGQFVTLRAWGQVADTPYGWIVVLARGDQTGGSVGIFRTAEPAGWVGPSRAHTREVQVFYVLEGTYRFDTGGVINEGGPGTTMIIPPNVVSHYENIGDTDGQLLAWVMPGGFERFLIDIDAPRARTAEAIRELEKQYGIVQPHEKGPQ